MGTPSWTSTGPSCPQGMVPDPESLDEVYVDRTYAMTAGLDVGDIVQFRVFPPEVLGPAFGLFEAGEFDQALATLNTPGADRLVELRVAGIGNGIDGHRRRRRLRTARAVDRAGAVRRVG